MRADFLRAGADLLDVLDVRRREHDVRDRDDERRRRRLASVAAGAGAAVSVAEHVHLLLSAGRGPRECGWAVVNICPWLVALEAAKRALGWSAAAAVLLTAGLFSVALGFLLGIGGSNFEFEIWRRLPPLAALAALVTLLRSGVATRPTSAEVPLLPRQIDWVRAAGNYVELRADKRTIVHRSPIGSIERELAGHVLVLIIVCRAREDIDDLCAHALSRRWRAMPERVGRNLAGYRLQNAQLGLSRKAHQAVDLVHFCRNATLKQ